jgi:hypothetical protein
VAPEPEGSSPYSHEPSIIVGNYKFEKVHMVKYLGSLVTDKNDISVEIKNRIGLGNKCYYGLRKHLASQSISLGTYV